MESYSPTRADDALWTVAFHLAGVSLGVIPARFQIGTASQAIREIAQSAETGARQRRVTVANMALDRTRQGGFAPDAFIESLGGAPGLAETTSGLQAYKPAIGLLGMVSDKNAASELWEALKGDFPALSEANSGPCSRPEGRSTLNGISRQTDMDSSYLVKRPIGDLRRVLDPRRWKLSGGIFADTYRVEDRGRGRYDAFDGDEKMGCSWSGHLFEAAQASWCKIEQVLNIEFVVKEAGTPSTVSEITVRYSLRECRAIQLWGLELPGLLRSNSGSLSATPVDDSSTRLTCLELEWWWTVGLW
jgi:hypothetical protein